MDQEQLLEAIKNPTSENAKTAAAALKKLAQPIYQAVFNQGHSAATEKADATETELKASLEEAQKQAKEAQAKVDEMKKGSPDVAKITEQYEAQITELKEKHKAEKRELVTKAENASLEVHRKAAVDRLVEKHDIPRLVAEVLLERAENSSRLKLKDGKLQILQAGKDIPIVVDAEQDPLDVYTAELAGAVPAGLKVSNSDRGAGSTSTSTGSGSGGYDPVKEGKARAEAQKNAKTDLAFT
jgi:DNA polymerase III gamma/tau subunit